LKEYKTISTEAYGEVKKLAQLSNLLDQRMNVLVNIFLNSFLLYDIQVTVALEKWKLRNKNRFASWMECVGNIESLISLSNFAFNHPSFCYPKLVDQPLLEATSLAHPLINHNERVTNDVSIGYPRKLLLVTGSNMSGKTTYLRTIGTNIVLAQCGAPVCAESFSFKPVHVYTSIRISDSLQDHTSYFMAELKRLSEIKEKISSLRPSLVLIDEILRGTNSEDKYFGSAQFVKKLIQYNCLTLFATHDLKLSELENEHEGLIENYCFESDIKEDELLFDYKVRKGVAQNKNASFLMKKMQII
jgi:DNA mismatch repair ATPase MutS